MLDQVLVPQGTAVSENGDSSPVGIGAVSHRLFLALLEVTAVEEQEAMEISLYGSKDGTNWGTKPLAVFPQRYYPGSYPSLLDLTADEETMFLRAHWDLLRWGRGEQKPRFQFSFRLREVAPEMLSRTP